VLGCKFWASSGEPIVANRDGRLHEGEEFRDLVPQIVREVIDLTGCESEQVHDLSFESPNQLRSRIARLEPNADFCD